MPTTLTTIERRRRLHHQWCQRNKARRCESSKSYRQRHPDRVRISNKLWREKNSEYLRKCKLEWRSKNKDAIRSHHKSYHYERYRKDPEYRRRLISQSKSWGTKNKDKRRIIYRNWSLRNSKYLALKSSKRRALQRDAVINEKGLSHFLLFIKQRQTVVCYYCKRRIPATLIHLDHILPIVKGGGYSMCNLCISCPSCNQHKSDRTLDVWPETGQRLLSI